MDPVTHTLVGAALGEAGLKRRSALGMATLMIGANLPDIDIVSLAWGSETALWFRRGITHGLPAVVLLPLLLTAVMVLWDRLARHRVGAEHLPAVRPAQVLLLAFLAVLSHPLLDSLNVYGMRWLMPFSGSWFYGDTLFIADPWVWVTLGTGVYLARRRNKEELPRPVRGSRPAALALMVVAVYVALMAGSNLAARSVIRRTAADQGIHLSKLMVAPLPINPFVRRVVLEDETSYRIGRFNWLSSPNMRLDDSSLPNYPPDPQAAAATRGPRPRKFLTWARFPFFVVVNDAAGATVRIGDARYTTDAAGSWAVTVVRVATMGGRGRGRDN